MRKHLCLIFVVLFLSACADKSQEHCLVRKSEIRSYESHSLSSMLSHLEFVPLETRDDCLIGRIDVVKKRSKRYYIHSQASLYAFDEGGKFLWKIDNAGQGPGEYQAICDFDADEEQLFILAPNKLMYYGLDGKFRKEVAVELPWGTIKRIKGGFLGYSGQPMSDGNGLAYMDDEGKVLKSAMPLDEHTSSSLRIDWPEYKKGHYLHQVSRSNELYCFDAYAKEFYTMPVIDDGKALSADEYADESRVSNSRKDIEGVSLRGFTGSASQLIWGVMEKKNVSICVYDKAGKTASGFSLLELKDDVTFANSFEEMMLMGVLLYNDSDDDKLVSYVDAVALQKEAGSVGNSKFAAAYDKLKGLPDDSNPVIVLLKFRQ